MHSHIICIRVDAAAEGAVYEVIAGPQEHQEQAQQEVHEHPARGPVDSSSEQRPEGKPRCTTYYFNFMTPIYVSITCALRLVIV